MADALKTLKKLPLACVSVNPADGKPILIKRGVKGYYPCSLYVAAAYNERNGITAIEVEAMESGSMFGREVPGADPYVVAASIAKATGRMMAEYYETAHLALRDTA